MNKIKPIAIVLSKTVTGLSTIRALAQSGVEVHAVIFDANDPVRFSRYCKKVYLYCKGNDEASLLEFLLQYAKSFDSPPVVFPTSDAQVLFLAKNFAALRSTCLTWTTKYSELIDIVSKDGLHRNMTAAGLDPVPSIVSPTLEQAAQWSRVNPEPYLIKPFYAGIPTSRLQEKNLLIATRDELLKFVAEKKTDSLIVQRRLQGGDGYIFDCYGYCDRNGKVLTMASHRRWRQNRPDFGATSFGEIPATIDADSESLIFSDTQRLLKRVKYHGIFGIEWLQDKETGKFYLIDFNARPFLTIGHLKDCGLNLPALAYNELIGENLDAIELTPSLKHLYWVDLLRDIESFKEKYKSGQIGLVEWLLSVLRCRSFAYQDWRDLGPSIYRIFLIFGRMSLFLVKCLSVPKVFLFRRLQRS